MGFCPASFGVVLQSGAQLPTQNLNYWINTPVSGPLFLTGGEFEYDIEHHPSVAVLCMLHKIRCNQVQTLNGALPGLYVPVRVTRGALVAHRYTYAPTRCRTSQYRMTFIPISVSFWNVRAKPIFDSVTLSDFKIRANASLLA